MTFRQRMFQRDLKAMIARDDARKAELVAARQRCQNSPDLVAHLQEGALRRGEPGIDWPEYFRNVRLACV